MGAATTSLVEMYRSWAAGGRVTTGVATWGTDGSSLRNVLRILLVDVPPHARAPEPVLSNSGGSQRKSVADVCSGVAGAGGSSSAGKSCTLLHR